MHHVYFFEYYDECFNSTQIVIMSYFIFQNKINQMANSIVALLSRTVLTGENFQKWKSDLNIVLMSENMRFILTDPCPPVPAANAQRAVRDNYERWMNANN